MTSGWAIFFIVLVVVVIIGVGGFFGWRFYQKRNGSNVDSVFPSPAPAGVGAWIQDKFQRIKNPRNRTGAGYESTGYGASGARGAPRRGPLDPDEAWDSRVGNEGAEIYGPGGYYEEQELGLHQPTAYSGAGYAAPSAGFTPAPGLGPVHAERGRSTSPGRNPFGDDAAASLRSVSPRPVSPRPIDTGAATKKGLKKDEPDSTSPRRSMFRENM
jgi:hypothetical protein